MKHTTLCNNYDNGDLKNVGISSKIISLQCFWIKKLYGNTPTGRNVISLHRIKANLELNFKIHLNLDILVQNL